MSLAAEEKLDPESPAKAEGAPDDVATDDSSGDAPEEAAQSGPEESSQPEEEASAAPEDNPAIPDEAPSQDKVPASNTFDVVGQRRTPVTPRELDNEDALYHQDLQRGRLKPETMHDLYAKQDTLGKIGTLFGILVSGAGSGLTGQPNAVLEMMKNQINNDFEAQKVSNQNAQNWLRLSQQHELNKAGLGETAARTENIKAQTGKVPTEIEHNKASIRNLEADTALKGTLRTKNLMGIHAYNYLQDKVGKMPDGPAKSNAVSTLTNTVGPAIAANNAENNAKTADQLNATAALRGDLKPAPQPGVDLAKMNTLKASGDAAASLGLPIMPGKGMDAHQYAVASKEAELTNMNRATYDSYKDSFEHLDKSALAGRVNKNDRDAVVDLVAAQISKQTGASSETARHQADDLFPKWNDWGNARMEKAKKGAEHFAIQESGTPVLDTFGLKTPFPGPPSVSKSVMSNVAAKEKKAPTAETKTIGGAQYKKVKGGWQKIK